MSIDIAGAIVFFVGCFIAGIVGVFAAVAAYPWLLRQGWLTWYRRWALHGLAESIVADVRLQLFEQVAETQAHQQADLYDWSKGKYVGKCACGCGMPIYYYGIGRRPKYVNQTHREFFHGLRKSPFG